MATQVTNYHCPNCNGPLQFDATSGKLECEYCSGSFSVEEIEKLSEPNPEATEDVNEEWDTSHLSFDWGEDRDKMRAYECPSCGARLLCDETTAATSCPYCGNPAVVQSQLQGDLKPDYIIPFSTTKEQAEEALRKHYKGKFLLPKAFRSENRIQEVRGIYVPFWLFDGKVDADIRYRATRKHIHRRGDEEIIVTDHYIVRRAGTFAFDRVPVDASTKMPDNHMDSIEPFSYEALKDFSMAYLPGFLADKFDVDMDECALRADRRCTQSTVDALRSTVFGYDTCITQWEHIRIHRGAVHYALLPVWMLNTKWKDKEYLFAMNGQTGRLVGNLPIHWGKFWGLFAAISLPLMALMSYLLLF